MSSYLVRTLALLIAIFSFWLAQQEPKQAAGLILGGSFFLALFVAAFFAKKYLALCIGVIFIYPVVHGWVTGTVFGFGRRASDKVLAQDPTGYWITMGLWLCASVGLIVYGVHRYFIKKRPNSSFNPDAQRRRAG
jgi:hypothetical protein